MTAMMTTTHKTAPTCSRVAPVRLSLGPQRCGDEPEPGQLPADLEQQDRQHPLRVAQSQQRQDGHGDEHRDHGAPHQLPGFVVDPLGHLVTASPTPMTR